MSSIPLHKCNDLLSTELKHSGNLIVVDTTYIAYRDGFAYISLLLDAFSHCIIGHCLHPTFEEEGCMHALNEAFNFFKLHNIDIHNMVHHSDLGVQYASNQYSDLLCS